MFKDFDSALWFSMSLEDSLALLDPLLFCPLGRFHFFPQT